MKKLIVISLILITAACTPAGANETYIALVDGSDSMAGENAPLQRNLAELEKALVTIPKGSDLVILAFGKNCIELLKAQYPRQAGPQNANLRQFHAQVAKKLRENLKERLPLLDRSSTDLVGALLRAKRIAEPNQTGKTTLYVFSDGLDTVNYKMSLRALSKEGSHNQFLARGTTKIKYEPTTAVVFYSMFQDSPRLSLLENEKAAAELKLFYEALFTSAGAHITYKNSY